VIAGMMVAALFGLVIGSFLNVCIYRLPREESVAWPASRCTSCRRALAWYENVPVLSWAVLRGRCRTCKAPVSAMYPVIELTTGILFAATYYWYGPTPLGIVRMLFGCAMVVLFVIDLQHQILPNIITVPGIVIGLALSLFLPPGWVSSLIGVAVGGGMLFAIAETYFRLRGIQGLGMGDVKMLAMIGAFLGWQLALLTLILSSFGGALVGVALIVTKRGGMQSKLPYGTFLAVAAAIAAVAGDSLVTWYLSPYQ
jgi:leader peptidase (prepilin peptidase) / N-methyltransferase